MLEQIPATPEEDEAFAAYEVRTFMPLGLHRLPGSVLVDDESIHAATCPDEACPRCSA